MTTEFGWWARDADGRRYQVRVEIFGDTVTWLRKQGHHQPWVPYGPPNDDDWNLLLARAEERVPRRLLSPRQFANLKRLRSLDQ
jgi:hypothetical protein